jgi:acetyl esterase/lipase
VAFALLLTGCMVPSSSGQSPAGVVPPTQDVLAVSYGPLAEQVLDIHYPTTGAGPFPVVLFAHSGGWVGGSRTNVPDVIATLPADTGVAVVSFDYRVATVNADGSYANVFPAGQQDMDRAIRWLRVHAFQYDLDGSRMVAAGSSAGGQMAAMAGAAPGMFHDSTLTMQEFFAPTQVQGVIDISGPSDLSSYYLVGGLSYTEAEFLGCPSASDPSTCDPALVAAASIAPHLDAQAPPAYLAYGVQDTLVSAATQGTPLAEAWAGARGDLARSPEFTRGVWYELEDNANHTFTLANSNYRTMELWLKWVLDGTLR